MRGTNNGGGARWGTMAWGVCPRCGLKHRIGLDAELGRRSPACSNRRLCDERRKRREEKEKERRNENDRNR